MIIVNFNISVEVVYNT